MNTSTLTPMTRHAAVCAGCGAEAVVRGALNLRGVAFDPYVGATLASATLDFPLPDGWRFDPTVPGFLCDRCKPSGLND